MGTNNKKAVGNREEAIRLLKETEIPANQICKMTGVPKGSIGRLAQMHRSQEVTDRVKKKARQESLDKRKVKWVEKPEAKPSTPTQAPPPGQPIPMAVGVKPDGSAYIKPEATRPASHLWADEELAALHKPVEAKDFTYVPDEGPKSKVEYNFNFNVSGKQVSVDEVITKLDELKTILKYIPIDAVNFRVNVGS